MRSHLLQACHTFMVPIARFLLRSGVSYKEFAEITRLAFVAVASEDYGIRGRPTNDSRIAAMTAIPRKEVRRLRESAENYSDDLRHFIRTRVSPLSEVLHRWFTDAKYLDSFGKPAALPFRGVGSFSDLVKKCASDLPAGAVRVELLRCGAVSEDGDGRLYPVRRVLVAPDLDSQLVSRIAIALRGLASTIAYNCNPYEPRTSLEGRIERVVHTESVAKTAVETLRPILRSRIESFAAEIDDLISKSEMTPENSEGGGRLGVGIYYYEDP